VQADDGRGGGDPLTLLQLHIGSCTKVTEQQSNGTDVCCCSRRSLAGIEAAYHISLYQRMTLLMVSRQPAHCTDPDDCLHSFLIIVRLFSYPDIASKIRYSDFGISINNTTSDNTLEVTTMAD